jgi:Ca2+-transporting ATPase
MLENDEERVITGQQLDTLTQKDLQERKPFPLVFARVSPANKLAIVQALKAKGEIVAMTGDGVNDAPAIKHAHCGVAMGLGGTDLTKQSADIVLLDDNFATIIAAVEEGRLTYDNISKFVLYLLACNSSEIYVTLAAVCIGYPSPFSPIMILWANLIIDLPPALALGVDPPLGDIMFRLPRNPKAHLLNIQVAAVLLIQGFVIALLSLGVYALGLEVLGYPKVGLSGEHKKEPGQARTLAFFSLASMHLMQGFISRSINLTTLRWGIFDNKALNYGVLLSFILLTIALYIPGLSTELEMYSLRGQDWGLVFCCLAIQLVGSELIKKFLVRGYFARRSARILAERKAKGLALFHSD